MTTTLITVQGMTCGNCVKHVKEAISELAGVSNVEIELEGGKVTIESAAALDSAVVSEVVTEAGYTVVV